MPSPWRFQQNPGPLALVRDCTKKAAFTVPLRPAKDILAAMPAVAGYGFAIYGESPHAALLARAMEIQASVLDMRSFGSIYRLVKRTSRCIEISGELMLANGRVEQAFVGGQPRMWEDYGKWLRGELPELPIQVLRMMELELAGVDGVEFPQNPAVDMRFGLQVGQPIVISLSRLRMALKEGRVTLR